MNAAVFVAATVFLAASTLSAGDLTITTKTSGRFSSTATTFLTANTMRSNDQAAKFDIVTDFKNGITYHINHKDKTISFTKAADAASLVEAMSANQPKGKGMAEFNAGMNDLYGDPSTFKVENAGTDTVIGRACNKTRITSGKLVWEYCMDPTLHSPIAPATMLKMTAASYAGLATHPKMAKVMSNLIEATAKLNGIALRTRMSGYSADIITEVTSISQSAIPASVFALPAGYTMTDQIAETKKQLAAHHH